MSTTFPLTRVPSLRAGARQGLRARLASRFKLISLVFVALTVPVYAGDVAPNNAPVVKLLKPSAGLTEEELVTELSRLAAKIPFINGDFVDQRLPREARSFMDDEERAVLKEFMVLAETADEARLWSITKHLDPQIRTLALIGTYGQGNPERLEGIYELTKDQAKTFPTLVDRNAAGWHGTGPIEEQRRKHGVQEQTVGDIAKRIIAAYLDTSAYGFPQSRQPANFDARLAQDFPGYWATHGNRKQCLSWFELALRRATHGATPLQAVCLPAVQRLREKVSALKPPYRGWITLSLWASSNWGNHDEDRALFASDAEVIKAAREIGTPALMRLFNGEIESDDPDLRIGRPGPFPYGGVCRLVLRHAADIFKPEEADEILKLEDSHRARENREIALVHPCWAIAAADLAPARAKEILQAAFERFKGDDTSSSSSQLWELAQAYWKHERMEGVEVVKNWFFSENRHVSGHGFARHRFARWLDDPGRLPLLKSIVLDPRLEQIDSYSMFLLMQSANKALKREIITRDELNAVSDSRRDVYDVKYRFQNVMNSLKKLRAAFR